MRVFFLPRWFPNPEDPLWGLFVLRHAQAVNRFAEVFVIYIDKRKELEHRQTSSFVNIEGIHVLYCFYRECSSPLTGRLTTLCRMFSAWRKAWNLAVKAWGRPDINHVHILTRLGFLAWWLKKRYHVPYVITEHWSRYLPQNFFFTGRFRRCLTRMVVRNTGAVMPVTDNLADAMRGNGLAHHRYIPIPNVVDTELFKPTDTCIKDEVLTFVHISTFDDRAKNISGIIRVFSRLKESGKAFRLKIVGDGADFSRITQLAADTGLTHPYVEFTGALISEEIAAHLSSSDMLVMFSNYENMPVVINEALACGIPVLATRVGGIPEVLNHRNGILVEPGDEEQLFSILSEITAEELSERFDREAIRREAVDQFSYNAVGSRINSVYKMVLNKTD